MTNSREFLRGFEENPDRKYTNSTVDDEVEILK
jgi:hypothetical protein